MSLLKHLTEEQFFEVQNRLEAYAVEALKLFKNSMYKKDVEKIPFALFVEIYSTGFGAAVQLMDSSNVIDTHSMQALMK